MEERLTPKSTYQKWMEEQGIPIIKAPAVEDVTQVARKLWPYLGAPAAFIDLDGMEGWTGMYVVEIPPGGALNPEKHLYDEILYIIKGSGFTEIGLKGKTQTFEWKERSLFSPPLNVWHRLVNGTNEPVIVLGITGAPIIMDLFYNMDFIFHNDFVFKDRYQEQEDYFTGEGKRSQVGMGTLWETNFVPDVMKVLLDPFERKAEQLRLTFLHMSNSSASGHIAEWPSGIYHKAHYHAGGIVLLSLQSKGYWLLWPSDAGTKPYQNGREDEVLKVNFTPGTVGSPATAWYHARYNTGLEPARQLALTMAGSRLHSVTARRAINKRDEGSFISTREGGTLIEYEDEDPEIRKRFEEDCRQGGVTSQMPPLIYRTD
ncbi:cupin domain-containing protein [Chloroflexota bacterium]